MAYGQQTHAFPRIRNYAEAKEIYQTTKPIRTTGAIPVRTDRRQHDVYRLVDAGTTRSPAVAVRMYHTDILVYSEAGILVSEYNSLTTNKVQNAILRGTGITLGTRHGWKTINGHYMLPSAMILPDGSISEHSLGVGFNRSGKIPTRAKPYLDGFLAWFGNYTKLVNLSEDKTIDWQTKMLDRPCQALLHAVQNHAPYIDLLKAIGAPSSTEESLGRTIQMSYALREVKGSPSIVIPVAEANALRLLQE